MAAPSYTYTLTNGTTADASQVMQNFNDVLNGISDGTKDITVNALTANGAANLKAAVTLGASTANAITVNGAIASTVNVGTDATYDLGSSTLGFRSLYLGANTKRVRIAPSGSTSASWTLTLPTTAGASNQLLATDGSGNASWVSLGTIGQLQGVTDGSNASSGNVGQIITNSLARSSATSLTTVTPANVTSLASAAILTAGDWDVTGMVGYTFGATTTLTRIICAFSSSAGAGSGTLPASTDTYAVPNANGEITYNFGFTSGYTPVNDIHVVMPATRISVSGSTSIYLVTQVTFGTSTCTAYGSIRARRVR